MNLSDFFLLYAKKGFITYLKKSCYRKFCRMNKGKKFVSNTRYGSCLNIVIGDSVDNEIYLNGYFERGTSELMVKLAKVSNCFVDIGCNIGYYSCLFGSLNKNAKIFSIDPNPQMITRVTENLQLNRIKTYKTFNFGVSSEEGTLDFYINNRRHSLGSFIRPYKNEPDGISVIKVDVRPLSKILNFSEIDRAVLKIDAEGYEWKILAGVSVAEMEKIDYVVLEFATEHIEKSNKKGIDIFDIQWTSNYKMFSILDDGSVEEFLYKPENRYCMNLLMVRNGAIEISEIK